MFHEFGHALHGLNSNVTYPSLSGTAVARDYVEFPSQLNEHWLSTPEVLNKFALHHQTGKPIPAALVDKIEKASTFNQGFATVEYLACALIDMKLHLAGEPTIDPDAFEKETLAELGMPAEIVMRHRTPQFGHVFSGDGYSAGYYSYLWSETLVRRRLGGLPEKGGAYDKAVATRLHENVFASATPSIPPTPTAPSAAATRARPRSCASADSRSSPRLPPSRTLVRPGRSLPSGQDTFDLPQLVLRGDALAEVPPAAPIPVMRVGQIAFHAMDDGVDPARVVVFLVVLGDEVRGLPVAPQGLRHGPPQLGHRRLAGSALAHALPPSAARRPPRPRHGARWTSLDCPRHR